MMKIGTCSLMLIFLISGCGFHTRISKIKHEPQKYADKQVSIKGNVVETAGIPFVQKGIYQVSDGTGKIWVVSQKRRPARGEKVTVKGKLRTGLSIGNQTFGIAIVEENGKDG